MRTAWIVCWSATEDRVRIRPSGELGAAYWCDVKSDGYRLYCVFEVEPLHLQYV